MTLYKTVAMDPPWPEQGGGKCKRGADRHYKLVKTKEDILRVVLQATRICGYDPNGIEREELVFTPDPAGCLLFCWTTRNSLLDAGWLINALGFRYVTDLVWLKGTGRPTLPPASAWPAWPTATAARLDPGEPPRLVELAPAGLGQWSRSLHEHLLLARRGKVRVPPTPLRPSSVIVAPREGHSVKPAVFYEMMERLGSGPRLEMFAREARDGWDTWGDEV